MLYLLVLMGFVFFAGVAMTINEGLWNNTILLICLLISGIAAVVAGVPAGGMLTEQMGLSDERAWFGVFAGVWGVFVVAMLVLRIAVDSASKVRVRFLPVVEKIGGILMGLFVAYMLTSFVAYTLILVPIQAGEWAKTPKNKGYHSNMEKVSGGFFSALNSFTKAEKAGSPFFGSKS